MRDFVNDWKTRLSWVVTPSRSLKAGLDALLAARLGLGLGIVAILLVKQVLDPLSLTLPTLVRAYSLLSILFAVSLVQSRVLLRVSPSWSWVFGNILFDSSLATSWLYLTAGQDSLFGLFYLIHILFVALIFFQREALIASLLASFGLGLMTWIHGGVVGGWSIWAIYSGLFLTLGMIGGYLSEELHRTTVSLEEESQKVESLQAFHEQIIQEIPTGLLTVDEKLQIKLLNPAGLHILGREAEEVEGQSLSAVEPGLAAFFTNIDSEDVDEDTEEQNLDASTALSATGGKRRRSFFVHPRTESSTRLQQCVEIGVGTQTRIIRGDVARVEPQGARVLLFQDVTKLLHLEERLRQNDKLAAVGQLAAGIAHEIRNPLAGVSGSIEMLRANPSSLEADESRRLMDIAVREIDRLNDLITEFLDFVKPAPMRFQPVDLAQLISETVESAQRVPEIQDRITVQALVSEGVLGLGNRGKLSQVLWNLILNGAQAIDGEGSIDVGCERLNDQTIKVWVTDTGPGMPEAVRERLFEPFFTTKDKGTGLGLATVYKIVDSHHGEIEVNTSPGNGATFAIYLQNAENAAESS